MALEKQIIPLSISAGVDTKTDPKQLNISSLYNVENVVYRTTNSFEKRNGYNAYDSEILGGGSIQNPQSTSVFNFETQIYTDKLLYARSTSAEKWVEKGPISNTKVVSNAVLRNNHQQTFLSMATVANINCYVWEDSRGGVRCSVIDSVTNTTYLHDVQLTATGLKPKVEALDNLFIIVYADGTNLKYRTINSADTTQIATEAVVASVLSSSKVFDIKQISNRLFIAYDSTASGGALDILSIDSSGVQYFSVSLPGETPDVSLNLNSDSNFRLLITYSDSTKIRFFTYTFTLSAQPIPPMTVETIAGVVNVNSIQFENKYHLVYEVSVTPSRCEYIKKAVIDSSGAITLAPILLSGSVGLASEQFVFNGEIFFLTTHESQLQSTYYMMNDAGFIVSKISQGVGGGLLQPNALAKARSLDGKSFSIATQVKGQGFTATETGVLYFLLGVNSSTFNFTPAQNYQQEILGKNLYITGGVLQNYDGANVTEDNFYLTPENLSTTQAATGGFLTDGTRQYVAEYMWTDNKGLIHRSGASIPLTVVQAAGGTTQTATITVPTIRLTLKENVIIEIYRTEDLGTTFYKVTQTQSPLYNNKTVDTVQFIDTVSDTDLLDNELLNETGGVLSNISAPAASIVSTYKNRIMLAGLENPNVVAYSKLIQENSPVEFNDALSFAVEDKNGGITALKEMDDKLIIFKSSSIYTQVGEGPNNTGTQSDYGQPQAVASDVGCITPDSVVSTPMGLMFQSQKGIYLLDRGLNASYIGKEVERYNDQRITSAVLVPNTNQVRFTTANSITMVYDYFVGRWSFFTNHGALDAHVQVENVNGIAQSTYAYLNAKEGTLWVETPGLYLDNGEQILITFESGWVSFAGLQGYQRVYKFLCLGELYSRHKLKISVGYDFTNAYIHDTIIDSEDVFSSDPYGTGTYGEQSPYGGNTIPYQMRIDLKKQKCESIRLKFEEQQNDTIGRGLSLSGLCFEVGGKKGFMKPSQGVVYGTA